MNWRMRIVHTTAYSYDELVTQSYNEVRLSPRSDMRQNVIFSRVDTEPSTRQYRYRDYWGTEVTSFDLHAPHSSLEVVSTSVVETGPTTPPEASATWAELQDEFVRDRYVEFLEPTAYVPTYKKLATHARRIADDCSTPADTVLAVSEWLKEKIEYSPGATSVKTNAKEAWKAGAGVCQDFTHLNLLMLRSVGIPSRYVSGYLHPDPSLEPDSTVEGQSHSWLEAWTGRWWSIDPTSNSLVSSQHVTLGRGRDYADVPPVKGIYSGGVSTELDVSVQVTRLA